MRAFAGKSTPQITSKRAFKSSPDKKQRSHPLGLGAIVGNSVEVTQRGVLFGREIGNPQLRVGQEADFLLSRHSHFLLSSPLQIHLEGTVRGGGSPVGVSDKDGDVVLEASSE